MSEAPAATGGHPARGWVRTGVGGFDLRAQWEIAPGEVMVLFGPSGAGKTTTLRAIAGLVRPLDGRIEIGGRPVYDRAAGIALPAHKRRVGYLTQQYHLFPHLTLAANIAYGLAGRKTEAGADAVRELLEAFHLGGLEHRYPWELSGGQQQRVALARALATRPDMLLLDEPFSSLDAELRRTVRRELRQTLAHSPVPVMLVTHDREEALALGDKVQVVNEGRVIGEGAPFDVLGQPGQGRIARLVGVENLFPLQVESRSRHDGTMVCTGQGLRLEVPLEEPMPGAADGAETVNVGIRASDIILAASEPVGSSARNRLRGVVTAVEARPPGYTVTLDCGSPLRCHITGSALEEMGVSEGQRLWAVFKASSCFLVEQ